LANRTRLKICALLFKQPRQSVSAIAEQTNLPLPVASQYLRALEARSLLEVRRVGRRVVYGVASNAGNTSAAGIVAALRQILRSEGDPIEMAFKTATAFTHPRRVEIYRALKKQGQDLAHLQAQVHVSAPAMYRHLRKLVSRGFAECRDGLWVATNRSDPLSRELARQL